MSADVLISNPENKMGYPCEYEKPLRTLSQKRAMVAVAASSECHKPVPFHILSCLPH